MRSPNISPSCSASEAALSSALEPMNVGGKYRVISKRRGSPKYSRAPPQIRIRANIPRNLSNAPETERALALPDDLGQVDTFNFSNRSPAARDASRGRKNRYRCHFFISYHVFTARTRAVCHFYEAFNSRKSHFPLLTNRVVNSPK